MSKSMKIFSAVLAGAVLGSIGTNLYNHQHVNPQSIITRAKQDSKFGLGVVKSIIENDPDVNDAAVVIGSRNSTQFGREYHNRLTDDGRSSVIVHPYDKQGSGVNITVFYTSAVTKELKVLLLQKLKKRNNPEAGLQDIITPIGGYTKGAGVEGSKKATTSFEAEEARDAAEDAFVEGGQQVTVAKLADKDSSVYLGKQDLKTIGEKIQEYFAAQLALDPYKKILNPEEVKEYLRGQRIEYNRDYNLIDAAMREFAEETCYQGKLPVDKFQVVYVTDDYGITNVPNLHTIVTHVLVDLGELNEDPHIYPIGYKGERKHGSLQPNGTEIGKLEWVDVSSIEPDEKGLLKRGDTVISLSYVTALNNAVKKVRDKELHAVSKGVIPSEETLQTWVERLVPAVFNLKSTKQFGQQAAKEHKARKCIAEEFGRVTHFDKTYMAKVFDNCMGGIGL